MKIGPTCPKSETVFIFQLEFDDFRCFICLLSFRVPAIVLFVEAWHRQLRSQLVFYMTPKNSPILHPPKCPVTKAVRGTSRTAFGGVQFFSGNVAEIFANDQGSWKNQPKPNALLIQGIPQIYLTFEWCLIPPKWVAFNDPWWHHPQAKNTQSSMSEWCILFS